MKLTAEPVCMLPGESVRLIRWTRSVRDVVAVDLHGVPHAFPGAGHQWHHHLSMELTLFQHGQGIEFIGDEIRPFSAPQLVLLGPGLPHYWHESGPTAGWALQFDPAFGTWLDHVVEAEPLRRLWAWSGRGLRFALPVVNSIMRRMGLLATSGPRRLLRVLEILWDLATVPPNLRMPISSKTVEAINKPAVYRGIQAAVRLLFERSTEAILIQELLRGSGLSRATFFRHFRRHTGRTVRQFLNDVRLSHAARELVETDRSIAEIAYAVGFGNLSHFHHTFRARFGSTPRQYRQRTRLIEPRHR